MVADGEAVCTSCGLVNGNCEFSEAHRLAVSPGKRPYLVDGLGSFVGHHNSFYFRDANGKPLPPSKQELFSHLKSLYDKRERFGKRGVDFRTLNSLRKACELLGLPKAIKQEAAWLYRKAIEISRGGSSLAVAAYCLVQAVRKHSEVRLPTLQEVVAAFRTLGHRISASMLVNAGFTYREAGMRPAISRSEEYVPRIVEAVIQDPKLKRRLTKVALQVLSQVDARRRRGRNPYVLSVSAVYAAERILARRGNRSPTFTQKSLALATGVAEYSIREHYGRILKPVLARFLAHSS